MTNWCLLSSFLGAHKQNKKDDDEHLLVVIFFRCTKTKQKDDDKLTFVIVLSGCIETKQKKITMNIDSSSSSGINEQNIRR
jgi:hypothetical protein